MTLRHWLECSSGSWQRWGMSGFFSLVSVPLNKTVQNRRGNKGFPVMGSVHFLVVSNLTWLLLIQARMADGLRVHHHHQTSVISMMFRQALCNACFFLSYFSCWSWSLLLEIIFFVICGRLVRPLSYTEDMCQCEHTYICIQDIFSTYVLFILGKESLVL